MDLPKLLRDFFAPIPDYSKIPKKKDTRTDEERWVDYQKENGTYLPPKSVKEKFCSAEPRSKEDILNIVKRLASEHKATVDKNYFFQKNADFFNCYAYASGGVGNPFVMEGYDKPDMTTAVPGALGGKPMRFVDEKQIHDGMVADGYTPAISDEQKAKLTLEQIKLINDRTEKEIRPNQILVAAFIDDKGVKREMHFAMRSQKGVWSQKFGSGAIENKDVDNAPITSPHLISAQTTFKKIR